MLAKFSLSIRNPRAFRHSRRFMLDCNNSTVLTYWRRAHKAYISGQYHFLSLFLSKDRPYAFQYHFASFARYMKSSFKHHIQLGIPRFIPHHFYIMSSSHMSQSVKPQYTNTYQYLLDDWCSSLYDGHGWPHAHAAARPLPLLLSSKHGHWQEEELRYLVGDRLPGLVIISAPFIFLSSFLYTYIQTNTTPVNTKQAKRCYNNSENILRYDDGGRYFRAAWAWRAECSPAGFNGWFLARIEMMKRLLP